MRVTKETRVRKWFRPRFKQVRYFHTGCYCWKCTWDRHTWKIRGDASRVKRIVSDERCPRSRR